MIAFQHQQRADSSGGILGGSIQGLKQNLKMCLVLDNGEAFINNPFLFYQVTQQVYR